MKFIIFPISEIATAGILFLIVSATKALKCGRLQNRKLGMIMEMHKIYFLK
jgi:hypothetical protein